MSKQDMRPTPPEEHYTIDEILEEFGSGAPAEEPSPIPDPAPESIPDPAPEPQPEEKPQEKKEEDSPFPLDFKLNLEDLQFGRNYNGGDRR